ncbi:olfactory receptor 14I1-like [Passerculus sandwichensis]
MLELQYELESKVAKWDELEVESSHTWQLQLLHFCLLLGISLAALLGNGLIISAVACSHQLHTPMFFFLLNLALADLGSICTTVPKAMHNSLWDTRNISYSGCATQVFFFVFYATAQLALLTIMCYDRYVSICKPLRIPSEQGRHKAFSTCLPHLAVLSLFISTAAFAHLKPSSMSSPSLDMALSSPAEAPLRRCRCRGLHAGAGDARGMRGAAPGPAVPR